MRRSGLSQRCRAARIGITVVVALLVQDLLFGVSVLDAGTSGFCVASLFAVGVLACA